MSEPYSKETQLARGERRYRARKASPAEWQRIIAAKRGQCLICERLGVRGISAYLEFHHLVPRSRGGDDVADNIVPLCSLHHGDVTANNPHALHALCLMLTGDERAYCAAKMGPEWATRLFGVAGSEQ